MLDMEDKCTPATTFCNPYLRKQLQWPCWNSSANVLRISNRGFDHDALTHHGVAAVLETGDF